MSNSWITSFMRKRLLLKQPLIDRQLIRLLLRVFPKRCRLLEAGSHSGHLSLLLARCGYQVTLLDRLAEPLEIAKRRFVAHGVRAEFIHGDIRTLTGEWDGVWNTGVVQTYDTAQREALIQKLSQLAPRVLLVFPDVSDELFPKQFDPNTPPGIAGCLEYPASDVSDLLVRCCRTVRRGRIAPEDLELAYPFEYVIGER
jgi:hypothetical protein